MIQVGQALFVNSKKKNAFFSDSAITVFMLTVMMGSILNMKLTKFPTDVDWYLISRLTFF